MAMIEAYRIGVELVLGGNLAAGVEALLPGLSRLDGSLSHANTEAKALATALGSVAATASGVGQAAGAMERLNAALTATNRAAAQPSGALAAPAIPRVTPPAGTGKTLPHIAEAPSPQTPVTASQVGSRDAAWQPSPAVTVQSLVQAVAPVRSVEAASPMRAAARIPVIRPPEVIPAQAGAIVRPAMSSVTAAPRLSDPRRPSTGCGTHPAVRRRPARFCASTAGADDAQTAAARRHAIGRRAHDGAAASDGGSYSRAASAGHGGPCRAARASCVGGEAGPTRAGGHRPACRGGAERRSGSGPRRPNKWCSEGGA